MSSFLSVTSDCKPWDSPVDLYVDGTYGLVSQRITENWKRDIDSIYRDYEIYQQGNGTEQAVFGDGDSVAATRSQKIADELFRAYPPNKAGKHLDIACGNGAFLRAASASLSGWELSGTEFNAAHRERILGIPNVSHFYTDEIDSIDESYDLISMIHALEHMLEPQAYLEKVYSKLASDGLLFIEVPYYRENPFELMIFDHASHFSKRSIKMLLQAAGFETLTVTSNWVRKELSIVARKTNAPRDLHRSESSNDENDTLRNAIDWLGAFKERAQSESTRDHRFGIFGSSIAATWLHQELDGRAIYFVDEDPTRIGNKHLGLPILSPREIPANAKTLIPLPPTIARSVAQKLKQLGYDSLASADFHHQTEESEFERVASK